MAGTNGLTFFFLIVSIVSINGCDKVLSKKSDAIILTIKPCIKA